MHRSRLIVITLTLLVLALSNPARLFEPLFAAPARIQAVDTSAIQITLVDSIYFAAILLGVVGKALWDFLNQGLGGELMARRVLLIKIALSTIIAMLIYATAITSVADSKVVTLAGLSVAFQGGFFWQSLLQNLTETMNVQQPARNG